MKPELLSLFLRALSMVESGNNVQAVGLAGELGKFQMMPAVVSECGGYGEREARREIQRIEVALVHMGVDPSPYNVALAWNAGLGAVRHGKVPESSYRHALRVVNLLEDLQRGQKR